MNSYIRKATVADAVATTDCNNRMIEEIEESLPHSVAIGTGILSLLVNLTMGRCSTDLWGPGMIKPGHEIGPTRITCSSS